jgi:hypothetical protein
MTLPVNPDVSLADPSGVRAWLGEQVARFVASHDAKLTADTQERVRAELLRADATDLGRLLQRMTNTGTDWEYQESDILARRLSHALGGLVFEPGSALEGTEHLRIAERESVTFLVNHLSFADANVLECFLAFAGFESVADRLTVLVGPKVYTDPLRRLMSLCFGAIKTPQSATLATGEAVMSKRAIATAAASTLRHFEARRAAGDHLLIFVEGSRSRTASMQAALPAVSRYIENPDAVLVPVGLTGSEELVPIGDERVHPTRVMATVGPPLRAAELWRHANSKRRMLMDVVGLKIAALVPPSYRGVYGDPVGGLEEARAVAAEI